MKHALLLAAAVAAAAAYDNDHAWLLDDLFQDQRWALGGLCVDIDYTFYIRILCVDNVYIPFFRYSISVDTL